MRLVLQTANVVSDAKNCLYPNRVEAGNAAELQEAIKKDHVCGEYKKNYRSKENFIRSNVAVMDCDNDHSEDPEEWITPEKMEELFGDFSYAIAFSRNHMKVKDGKSERPRFHVYFQIEEITDEKVYAGLKIAIQKQYTFFDDNALDAARFIFGADTGEVIWHEGWMTIDEEINPIVETDEPEKQEGTSSGPILQGSRNNTMSRFASRILKRYGDTEKAHVAFMEHAEKCDPPLPEAELNTIWNSAVRFFNKKISSSDGYVPPDQYNADFSDASLKPEDYSDIGQAKVLVQEYGSELRFSAATDYLRYDGERWVEDVQLAIGAIEEFLDLQLVDAQQDKEDAEKALVDAGIPEPIVKNGSKAVAKEVTPDQIGLVTRVRQGLGKPDRIYVHKCVFPEMSKGHVQTCQNDMSGAVLPTLQDMSKRHANNTDKNNTEISETDLISSTNTGWDKNAMEEREAYREYFRESCSLEVIKADQPYDRDMLDEILELLVEVCSSTQKTIRISGDEKPIQVVKSRFMKLEQEHIQYVLDCFRENTTKVRNIKQYLLASLYNAPMTIDSYYRALVQHDMYGKETEGR